MKVGIGIGGIGIALTALFAVAGCADQTTVGTTTDNISGPSITTDNTTYTAGATVNVEWAGMPGNTYDWVSVATAGADVDSNGVQWEYIDGAPSGSAAFADLASGNYEARAYTNDSFDEVASSTFTINAAATAPNPAITTSATTYTVGQSVVVDFSNMPGNMYDWVSIATVGTPTNSNGAQWTYIDGTKTGSASFSGVAAGSYEARAYTNDSFTEVAVSTFSVGSGSGSGSGSASVTTSMSSYAAGSAVIVEWSGLPGNMYDWVSVDVAGTPTNSNGFKFQYVNGQTSGSASFGAIPAGNYEVRAYSNDTFTELASSTFTVVGSPAVAATQMTYAAGSVVTVNFSGLPGNQYDWVSIDVAGTPTNSNGFKFQYVNGANSGSIVFGAIPSGNYEARAYLNDTFTELASSTFTVSGSTTVTPTITTDASTYTAGSTVTVDYTNLPGNKYDWLAIAVAGSTDQSSIAWVYTNGSINGAQPFTNIPAGSYEARAFSNDSFNEIVFSTFTVTP